MNNIPSSFAVCNLADCPRKATSLRYQVMRSVLTVKTVAYTILPSALSSTGECVYYRENSPSNMAYGFKRLLSNVNKLDVAPLRTEIMNYVGSHGGYYRYNKGEKLLTPAQQQDILEIFRRNGYTDNLQFDGCITTYDFSD